MKSLQTSELLQKFEHACNLYSIIGICIARDLQEVLRYSKWNNFKITIDKFSNKNN